MATDDDIQSPDWRELYRLALLETDPYKLPQRVSDATHAVLEKLTQRHSPSEDQDLQDALLVLGSLRRQYNHLVPAYGDQ